QAEWQEVRAMGEDLVPHNPLFGGHEDIAHAAGTGWPHHDFSAAEHAAEHVGSGMGAEPAHDQNFDLGPFDTRPATKAATPEESFRFAVAEPPAGAHRARPDDGAPAAPAPGVHAPAAAAGPEPRGSATAAAPASAASAAATSGRQAGRGFLWRRRRD